MCGICGIYQNKKSGKRKLKEAIGKMNQSQSRRGPDDEGVFIDEKSGVAFGHRRLSILDLSKAGHQPMGYKSQISNLKSQKYDLLISFNGEIYNFQELKKDLEKKGYKFKTKTDTEVILALYAEYGEKSFSMLRGMFVFGLWDDKNKKLFLVKDRYGVKPLYYYADNEKLIFASTVKAIAESGLVPLQKNPQAYIGFLLFGSVSLPLTTYKNILAVPVGYYLVREADGKQELVQHYNSLEFFNMETSDVPNIDGNYRTSDVQNIISKTRNLLEESVNLHLISDAPLGIFLSGGLDSSAIAVLAAYNMDTGKSDLPRGSTSQILKSIQEEVEPHKIKNNSKLITLSIIFDEPEFSEEYYSDLVAKKINSDHRKIKITKQDFHDSLDEIFEAMDQPTIDGVNTFFIAKAAKQAGLKSVLSGLGADEIFLGYPHFRRAELLRKIQNLPIPSVFWSFSSSVLRSFFGDRYSKLSYFADNDILSFYLGIRGLFTSQETAKILDINLSEVNSFISNMLMSDIPEDIDGNIRMSDIQKLNPVNLLSYLELKFYLQNQLLKDTDFMSMRHSVEVRVPFLDHKLVEYLSSLPAEIKLNIRTSDVPNINVNSRTSDVRNINKPLLVAAVRDLLPQEIFTRPKMGFTFPFQKWLNIDNGHWSHYWAMEVLNKF